MAFKLKKDTFVYFCLLKLSFQFELFIEKCHHKIYHTNMKYGGGFAMSM